MKKKLTQIFSKFPVLEGVEFITANIGIKSELNNDTSLIIFKELTNCASVLTKSKTCAPNISWLKKIKKTGVAKALFVNSGNANAYTGKQGYENVIKIVKKISQIYNCDKDKILVSSTGVIGEQLPIRKILDAIPKILNKKNKNSQNWLSFANAIRTTDTFPKGYYKQIIINKKKYNIVGVCKGSGMIAPNMATMLAFIFTDFEIPKSLLNNILLASVEKSFNNITVDGDTSTNDMVSLFSIKNAKKSTEHLKKNILSKFQKGLDEVTTQLAKQIVVDGEGATKLIEVVVNGAENNTQAKNVSMNIANSLLVKTAIAGEDANWGRIIMAIGKSSATLDQSNISIKIGSYVIINKGKLNRNYNEALVTKYLKKKEILITIDLFVGKGSCKVWTCDLTKRYIEINADYRS